MYIVDCKAGRSPAYEKKLKPINEGIKKMKKIFAIMMVAVIAVAGAFAVTTTDDSSVELKYVIPAISNFGYQVYDEELPNPAQVGTSVTVYTASTTVNDLGIKAGDYSFGLYDYTSINKAGSMTLAVSVNSHWKKDSANGTDTASALSIDSFAKVDAAYSSVANASVAKGDGNDVTVTYTGGGVDSSTTPVKIATFDVKWTADPAAVAADYYATLSIDLTTV